MSQFKGSKRCMLELISSESFVQEMNKMIYSTGARLFKGDSWLPEGLSNDTEAELKDFLKDNFDYSLGDRILKWWLAAPARQSRTPNWDFVSTCQLHGTKGILLVEAKAHFGELDGESKGKILRNGSSDNSIRNHESIGLAIDQARSQIAIVDEAVKISRDVCYQFSNRIAHAWWLANNGIPVVLIYLGFLNAKDMISNYDVFNSKSNWDSCLQEHAKKVGSDRLIGRSINCGKSSFTLISASLEDSLFKYR